MPLDPQFLDITFPVAGVDASTEYGQQTPATTVTGRNVRGFEAATRRQRGGSRCGLSRYIAGQVSGDNPVQHLCVIVDPTPRGLPGFGGLALGVSDGPGGSGTSGPGGLDLTGGGVTDSTTGFGPPPTPNGPTTPTTEDPSSNNGTDGTGDRNPGRRVRTGGSGEQPNRRVPTLPVAGDDWVQTYVGAAATSVDVLANDRLAGTPTVTIVSGPSLTGVTGLTNASAVVTGLGTGSRIRYTPPDSGAGGTDTIVYRLTDPHGHSALASLTIRVTDTPDPDPGPNYRSVRRTYSYDPVFGGSPEFPAPVGTGTIGKLTTCFRNLAAPPYTFRVGAANALVTWPGGTFPSPANLNALVAFYDTMIVYTPAAGVIGYADSDQGGC